MFLYSLTSEVGIGSISHDHTDDCSATLIFSILSLKKSPKVLNQWD